MLQPDLYLNIKFYDTSNGGRKGPTPSDFFGCVFVVDNENFDGRMLLSEISAIYPGDTKDNVPVKFLNYQNFKNKIYIGKKIYIWDGGVIGEGIVTDFIE